MFGGKKKAITFSYDDGVMQDVRLSSLMKKHGVKATFNINSYMYKETDVEREFFRFLVREGIHVKIESNMQ